LLLGYFLGRCICLLKMNRPFIKLPSILVWNLCKFHVKCDRFSFRSHFSWNFTWIFTKIYKIFTKIHQNSSNHRNMFEVVPENNHYNLKTTPTPYSPPPPSPQSG
jgi:hypothetical protein